jgi:hypothetical protein
LALGGDVCFKDEFLIVKPDETALGFDPLTNPVPKIAGIASQRISFGLLELHTGTRLDEGLEFMG